MSQPVAGYNGGVTPEELYLHLMKQCLTRMLWREKYRPMTSVSGWRKSRIGAASIVVASSPVGSCQN